MRTISILGSTGSVGKSTLAVVDAFPDELRVTALAAGGNVELLAEQVLRYRPEIVSVRSETDVARLRALIGAVHHTEHHTEIVHGMDGACAVATRGDAVIAAIVGAAGIGPVYAALRAGKRVGLANKEVLVAAGDVMTRTARETGGEILPVDSEHNAIHQAIRGGTHAEVERIILTASGGPFLHRDLATFSEITVTAALAHPTWKMGNKITVDSATMMNKGLEVIEAHHLFDVPYEDVRVAVHRQSVVHGGVLFEDGSVVLHAALPDMRLPIAYGLLCPERVDVGARPVPFDGSSWTFEEPRDDLFRCLPLAVEAGRAGGAYPVVLNAANEVVVEAFLERSVGFLQIAEVIEDVLDNVPDFGTMHDLEAI